MSQGVFWTGCGNETGGSGTAAGGGGQHVVLGGGGAGVVALRQHPRLRLCVRRAAASGLPGARAHGAPAADVAEAAGGYGQSLGVDAARWVKKHGRGGKKRPRSAPSKRKM